MLACGLPAHAASSFTVVLLRHGVRSPTKVVETPAFADWRPTPPGALTAHGARLMTIEGNWFSQRLVDRANNACDQVPFLYADIDERTLESAKAFGEGWCSRTATTVLHHRLDVRDPLFSGSERQAMTDDAQPDAADALTLEHLLASRCPACAPKHAASLKTLATEGENLFLEYAQCRPLPLFDPRERGANAVADVTAALRLHVQRYETFNRQTLAAAPAGSTILAHIVGLLQSHAGETPFVETPDTSHSRVAVLLGHDTQLGTLGGLLALHWSLSTGFPDDDMPPGSGLIFELQGTGADARVHLSYVSMTLAQFRSDRALTGGIVVTDLGTKRLSELAGVVTARRAYVTQAWNGFDGSPWTFPPPVDPRWTDCASSI